MILLVGLTELKAQISWQDTPVRAHFIFICIHSTNHSDLGNREKVRGNVSRDSHLRLNPISFRSDAVIVYDCPLETTH